jgi:chromosome segregation ATPase
MDDLDKSDKAGRRFSNSTVDKINKVFDSLKSSFEEVQNILKAAENERQPDSISKSDLEVLDMNEDEVKALVKKAVEDETKELKEQNEALKTEVEELKKTPAKKEEEKDPEDKVAAKEKDDTKTEDEIPESVKTELETLKEENASIKSQLEKLGVKPESKAEKGQDNDDPNASTKSLYQMMGRNAAGDKIQ